MTGEKMIEMRWVRGAYKADASAENSYGDIFSLQYRYQLQSKLVTENGSITGLETQWSDWIDVPTVTG